MVVTYHIEGTVELVLNNDQIKQLKKIPSKTMKHVYLEKLLNSTLESCSHVMKHELDTDIDFENVFVKINHEKCESEIEVEKLGMTDKQLIDNTLEEIGNRKVNHKH